MKPPVLAALLILALVAGCTGAAFGYVVGVNAREAAPRSVTVVLPSQIGAPSDPDRRGTSDQSREPFSGHAGVGGAPLPAAERDQPASSDVSALATQDPGEAEGGVSSSIAGSATWYCSRTSACTRGYGPSDMVAAIDPTLGIPKGARLRVHHGDRFVDVTVVDVCLCRAERIIDLTSGAFSRLAPLSRGVIRVSIEGAVASLTQPPTDSDER